MTATPTLAGKKGEVAPKDIVVVGAGIVGLSAAIFLRHDGHRVTLCDPRGPGGGASHGNAGGIVVSGVVPLAMPGVAKKAGHMLFDPMGPLKVRWSYLPQIAPWLWDLWRSSHPEPVEAASRALADLNADVHSAWGELLAKSGATDLRRPRGWLKVYETDESFEAARPERDLAARRGVKLDILSPEELRQLEPNLAPIFRHGVYDGESRYVVSPPETLRQLAETFVAAGGRLSDARVEALRDLAPGVEVATDRGPLRADVAVLAAGAWSKAFLKGLGVGPRLDTERGYHLMMPQPERTLLGPVVNAEHYLVLTPMDEGLRMTSGVEFAGLAAAPDYRRIERLLAAARRMLPGLSGDIRERWMGFRPSVPDSLPVIGPAPALPGVICAFGHGHLGLTQGPATGRIVADLVAGRQLGLDIAPFSPGR